MKRISEFLQVFLLLLMFSVAGSAADGDIEVDDDFIGEESFQVNISDPDLNNDSSRVETALAVALSDSESAENLTESVKEGKDQFLTDQPVHPGKNNSLSLSAIDYISNSGISVGISSVERRYNGTALVMLNSTSDSDDEIEYKTAETVELTETEVDTGFFVGEVQTSSSDEAGVLQVSGGDEVVVNYYDAEEGHRTGNNRDALRVDLSPPTLESARTVSEKDINVTIIDGISGLDKGSIALSDFEVTGISPENFVKDLDVSNIADNETGDQTAVLELNNSMSGTGIRPTVKIVSDDGGIKDRVGNSQDDQRLKASDFADPVIDSAIARDTDNDGRLNVVRLTLSEDIVSNRPPATSFSVETGNGKDLGIVEVVAGGEMTDSGVESADNGVLIELEDKEGGTGRPIVSYSPPSYSKVQDSSSNNNLLTAYNSMMVSDGAQPVLKDAVVSSSYSTSSATVVRLEFSEPVGDTVSDNLGVTLAQKDIDFEQKGFGINQTVNYSEVLDLEKNPKVTGFSDQVVDENGNNPVTRQSEDVEIKAFKRKLVKGWNFFSLPIADGGSRKIDSVLNTSELNAVWSYADGRWMHYSPETSNNDFESFEAGRGYLVNLTANQTVAPVIDTSSSSDSTEVDVKEGWNLVGSLEEFNQTVDDSGMFAELDSDTVQEVRSQETEGETDTVSIAGSGGSGNYAVPSQAYWVELDSPQDAITASFFESESGVPFSSYIDSLLKRWFG